MHYFKVTLKQQLLILSSPILLYSMLGLVYLYFFGFTLPSPVYMYAFLVLFFIDLLPALILHIQYLNINSGSELIIDSKKRNITYTRKNKSSDKSFDDIKSIKNIASFGGGSNSGLYSFGEYSFCKITFKDETFVFITCLMINRIRPSLELLLEKKVDTKLKFFPFINIK